MKPDTPSGPCTQVFPQGVSNAFLRPGLASNCPHPGGFGGTMLRTILTYGVILAAGSVGLQWLQYRFLVHTYPIEAYVSLVALAFLVLGVWAGARMFRRGPQDSFERNTRVKETLGISERELQVLELLAQGRSNKEIANQLSVSPNTVKTHVSRVFEKLEVRRRTEAILRARELGMIQ
jgi:DNA-binding CsgD family transcriptional regulator